MQTIIHTQTIHQPTFTFIPPEQVLCGLLATQINNCNCSQQQVVQQKYQQSQNIENVQAQILSLQQTLDAMNHQVVEVEGMLSQRDMLYHQLDHLRAEREQIQDQIENYELTMQKTVKIKASRGLKEMNERLRRRIKEVREYIDKMDNQNLKIEESMSTTYTKVPNHYAYSYTEYRGPTSPRWVDRNSPSHYSNQRVNINKDYYDGLRKRLQMKQEEAWERVRRQQEQIESRNARSLMNFNRVGMRSGFLSPKYGAY